MKSDFSKKACQSSICYKLLAGSWFLGWLVDTPADRDGYYETSVVYRFGRKLVDGAAKLFYRAGAAVRKYEKTSLVAVNPLGVIGMLMFFYLSFDISLNDYSWQRTLAEIIFILLALLLAAARSCPGLWKGTAACRAITWWIDHD